MVYLFRDIYICIKRQRVQTLIVAGVVFLVAIVISGALLANQAIKNTDKSLRSLLPAVAILEFDELAFAIAWNETGVWPNPENMTTKILNEIGMLPEVRSFNFTVRGHGFYSEALDRVWHPGWYEDIAYPVFEVEDIWSLSHQHNTNFEQFLLKGIGSEYIFEIEFGIIEMIQGRTFTSTEIEQGAAVAIISEYFLITNNLRIGDMLLMEHIVKDYTQPFEMWYDNTTFLSRQSHEFEIIGIFNRELPNDRYLFGIDIDEQHQILNEIYVPAAFVESSVQKELEIYRYYEIISDDVEERFYDSYTVMDALGFSNIHFILYDPLYLLNFHKAVDEILPEFWMLSDYAFAYSDIAISMHSIKAVADNLLLGSVLAMVIVLVLVIILFLRNRRQELGIYLALGKSKLKIFLHILFEILIPTIIAMTVALFVGKLLANRISRTMLLSHMEGVVQSTIVPQEMKIVGFRHGLINEEMIELFDVSFDTITILLFYSIGLSVILLSASFCIFNTLKVNPRDIITKSEI